MPVLLPDAGIAAIKSRLCVPTACRGVVLSPPSAKQDRQKRCSSSLRRVALRIGRAQPWSRPLIVKEVLEKVSQLRETGVSILIVEQNARAALQIADYGYVLESGTVAMEGQAGISQATSTS